VTALHPKHYIVRTSGLFGAGGANFVRSIRRAAAREGRVRVVVDQVCRPTYAGHLAKALGRIVGSGNFGVYHVASAGETSWFDFARAILELDGRGPEAVLPISSPQLDRPAPRPAYSVLDTRAYELTFGHVLPHWREGLEAYMETSGV
jgi:dTDP-4-dehydrorhamnose reductase